jgi:hypothetical protein
MDVTLRILTATIALTLSFPTVAQLKGDKGCKPPITRVRWHDLIDGEQRNVLKIDGRADAVFYAGNNDDVNYHVSQAVTQRVDAIQCLIEKDTAIADQKKVAYLRGLENILRNFSSSYKKRSIGASVFPIVMETFVSAINMDKYDQSIEAVLENVSYDVGSLVLSSAAFDRNASARAAKIWMIRKQIERNPEGAFYVLKENPNVPFRDSLIRVIGKKYPRKLYDYAAANNSLGMAIRSIDDPFIKTVSKMATTSGGTLYFPFLDNILAGKQSFEEIDAVKGDDLKYYRLLVKTRLDYTNRIMDGEQINELASLDFMLGKRAKDVFIKTINGLHEEPDAVRFRILHQLTPQELYYLVTTGESEIYTSSYTKGIYPIMMQKIGNRGDSLLMAVGFDHFKKFIKMAAGYNTLSHFLNTFPRKDEAQSLMTAFVNGLEKNPGLEEGVDVADSYASISETMKPIADEMLKNVKINYDRNVRDNNRRGMVIYDILYKLFLSADSTNNINLTQEFGIPPVYTVDYNSLAVDTAGKVVMQVFFFGDDDGRNNFNGFLGQFSNRSLWKRTDEKQWISFSSVKGKPVHIYLNKWFDEDTGEDEKAQTALTEYLVQKGMSPTVVIHRGHSYYAESTIEHIQPSARVVFLGSCGGYHLIHEVLEHSGDAHIIASKQIGRTVINRPFIDLFTDKLRNGKNIEWASFWNEFRSKAGREPGFEDYIPPHKNLGAIFIKAYGSAMGESAKLVTGVF